jgi:Lsr2
LALPAVLCNDGRMAKTVIVKLTDDIDGGDADETISFALDGRTYEIDVSSENAARLRSAFEPFVGKARLRSSSAPRSAQTDTMYSKLGDDEKARFRAWANMATARRISDERVKGWIAAGRP